MIKCDLGKGIEIKGNAVRIATEFKELAIAIRDVFVSGLGEECGNKFFDDCIANSKINREERLRQIDELERTVDPEVVEKVNKFATELIHELFGQKEE